MEVVNGLFEKVVAFYERGLGDSPDGVRFLEGLGFSDMEVLRRHRVGYSDGGLSKALPRKGKTLSDLKTIGLLLDDGSEQFLGCVVVPLLDIDGRICGFYGMHIGNGREVRLPGSPPFLFNIAATRIYPEIIIAGGIFDALAFETAGACNALGMEGSGLSKDMTGLLVEQGVRRAGLLPGLPGGTAVALNEAGIDSFEIAMPPGLTAQRCLLERGAEGLLSLLAPKEEEREEPVSGSPSACSVSSEVSSVATGGGFSLRLGPRTYEVIGLEKGERLLKATVRVSKGGLLHVDTLDLYRSKQRRQFCADVCLRFDDSPENIEADIGRLVAACENPSPPPGEKENDALAMSAADREAAEELGRSPDLIGRIVSDFEKCGLVGEESNKLLCYLAMTSRKMDDPLSVMILSSSGAGKSALQDAALAFCPPEDLVKLTSLSAKALFYKERFSLKHKVLAVEEGAGAEEAGYAIRNLISSDGLTSEVAVRDPQSGKLTTLSNTVEGPAAVFCTTTDPEVDQETRSRFLVTGIDESREQTRRILEFQRERHGVSGLHVDLERERVLALHRNFQRLLRPLKVVNPHISSLGYDDDRLQGRRCQPQYLNLIGSIAFLRQMGRELKSWASQDGHPVEYVEVLEEDVAMGAELAARIMGRSLDELSIPARNLLGLVEDMVRGMSVAEGIGPGEVRFTRRDIREHSGWTRTRTQIHLRELVEMEYIVLEGRKGGGLQFYRLLYRGQGSGGRRFVPGLRIPAEDGRTASSMTGPCRGQGEVKGVKKAQVVDYKSINKE